MRTVRAEGRPSGVAVASVMAFGSCRSAASALSNHPRNCSMGSGAAPDSSSPVRVYSLRRRATGSKRALLPAPGAGCTLERAGFLRGDPTTMKVPRLRLHLLTVHPISIHPRRIERNVVFEILERGRRIRVEPGRPRLRPPADRD